MMRATPAGVHLIQRWESCRLEAYQDGAGVWTIGWGTTRYPDGTKVLRGDRCTQSEADAWFAHDLAVFEVAVDQLTRDDLAPHQFDALVVFTYNVGITAYRASTLRKKVNANPDDPGIRQQFMRWVNSDGKRVRGLHRRRHAEADHYFGVTTPEPPFAP